MCYQETVVRCNAETLVQQLECCLHKFPEKDCSPEKCAIAAAQKFPTINYISEHGGDPCLWCRNLGCYCDYRMEGGECMFPV